MSRINYAIEAWGGFVNKDMINKIDKMFKKARKWGLCSQTHNLKDIRTERCRKFFHTISKNPAHCLHYFLPPTRPMIERLRPKLHDYCVPHVNKQLYKNSFIIHCLFEGAVTASK